tara:strand:+ start:156 stop:545 length:390 start_codon:yes stop_codon:yes gene_type:complete
MAKNKLSEKINNACGNLKGAAKKKCVNIVRNRINMDAEREMSYADLDRLRNEKDAKIKQYGESFVKAIEHVKDKKNLVETAQHLYEIKKGVWDVKGRERTLEDSMFDARLDANLEGKIRRKEEKTRWKK